MCYSGAVPTAENRPGQRSGTGGDDVYLQAAQAELWEAVRGRKEVAETDCREVGLAEKSKAAAWMEVKCDKYEFVGEHI